MVFNLKGSIVSKKLIRELMCLTLLVRLSAFIISMVGWLSSYMEVGSLETFNPRFCGLGRSHWIFLVDK